MRLFERLKAKTVILHPPLLGVGGSIYTSHTFNHLTELGFDSQKAHKTTLKLHAQSVLYAHKLTTTRRSWKIQLLLRSWSGAGVGLPPSRSSLVLPFPW